MGDNHCKLLSAIARDKGFLCYPLCICRRYHSLNDGGDRAQTIVSGLMEIPPAVIEPTP